MYGLLGKTLKHSFSKTIHEMIRPMTYHLFEVDDLHPFFSAKNFKGINVTIPYKQEVLKYVDTLDETVKLTNATNTIINNNGLLFAYNTDYLALKDVLANNLPTKKITNIAIIGNGATMASTKHALKALNYEHIHVYARNPKDDELHLSEIDQSTQVMINTTPVGMYPNNHGRLPIDLKKYAKLVYVFDLIYNPFKTNLLLEAEALNIKTTNGLDMLIRQAIYSNQLFFNQTYGPSLPVTIKKAILEDFQNIVFIGLPFSGKTHYAKRLGNRLDKTFIDTDIEIEKAAGKSIEKIFLEDGEAVFRAYEETILLNCLKEHQQVIAPGGGIVENDNIVQALKQNSFVIFLDMDEQLMASIDYKNRPTVKNKDDLLKLKKKRYSTYVKLADIIIKKDTFETKLLLQRIEAEIYAYLNR